jgi:hypothetical protein
MFAICTYPEEYKMFFKDALVVFLGEIPNMPGHCVVAGHTSGRIYSGFHTEIFQEYKEDQQWINTTYP